MDGDKKYHKDLLQIKEINVSKELDFLNSLYNRHNFKKYGYNLFTVTEIISLRRDYFSTYIFSSSKQ